MTAEIIRYLVLDPGSSTGYANIEITKQNGSSTLVITEYGYIDVDNSSEFVGDHCISLYDRINGLLSKTTYTGIVMEDFFFSNKYAKGSPVNSYLRASIMMTARKQNLPYYFVNTFSWKKHISGKIKPSAKDKAQWGNFAKKIMIQDALWKKYKIRLPNHSISEKNGRVIRLRLDIVDVLGQAIYFGCSQCGVTDIRCTVPIPDDVVFSKESKREYRYI